ncbi:hypothetical protein SUTH_03585 [Sulfuritalea hydrogenivorans sk43H]|jgi:hypothetical protein|uniref:Uncharacterized protein n=2 Tax=Sulfuritalea hydrogenivorans TaxID=748811 RepID=W0SL63_9PROT|nr:hypothetical protein SUTH_03585 [Sulfuritalea hydrogenivorans sk43H]
MNVNNQILRVCAGLFLGLAVSVVSAEPLNAHSNQKINSAKAKGWNTGSIGTDPALQKDVVKIQKKKDGGCSDVNVGTAQKGKTKAGEKAPKDIVVATKNVINVCK